MCNMSGEVVQSIKDMRRIYTSIVNADIQRAREDDRYKEE